MYPNDNKQPLPVDYLNQIAPNQTHKINLFNKQPLLLGGIGIIVLLIVTIIVASLMSGGIKPTERLAARLTATASVVDDAKTKMKSSQLRAINATLSSLLINSVRDITPILTKDGIKIDKLSKSVVATESTDAMMARLEDARLNVKYDRIYAQEMATQLENILILMNQIENSTSSSSLKTYLSDNITNLQPIQKQFSDFQDPTL